MNKNILKRYVSSIDNNFDKEDFAERIFITINRLLGDTKLYELKSGIKLLDIGSGDGSFIKICQKNNINSEGIDGSTTNINFETDKLNYEDNTFDVVTFLSVIEHINNPNNVIEEICRILKKGGLIITITPNFKYAYKNFYDDPTHLRPYTDKSIDKLMSLHKLTSIRTVPFLVNKSLLFWKIPFKFKIASLLPLKNHHFKKLTFLNFLKGNSTAMINVSRKL